MNDGNQGLHIIKTMSINVEQLVFVCSQLTRSLPRTFLLLATLY